MLYYSFFQLQPLVGLEYSWEDLNVAELIWVSNFIHAKLGSHPGKMVASSFFQFCLLQDFIDSTPIYDISAGIWNHFTGTTSY